MYGRYVLTLRCFLLVSRYMSVDLSNVSNVVKLCRLQETDHVVKNDSKQTLFRLWMSDVFYTCARARDKGGLRGEEYIKTDNDRYIN